MTQVSCPSCGGPIAFKIGTALVNICPYCRSVVARGDRKLEDLGKVAAIAQTDSFLRVGLKGRHDNVPFELVGRVQLGHQAGGKWDEWYAAFADGRWGWIAEAQGRIYLTFRDQTIDARGLPPWDRLQLEKPLAGFSEDGLVTAEKGQAEYLAAEGELPFTFTPRVFYPYADLSGPGGRFGTIDYGGQPPLVFLGREVTLDELGVPKTARVRQDDSQRAEGIVVSCPHCAGPLDLRAPDHTQRIGCPSCGSLLSVQEGNIKFLQALELPKTMVLPLGVVGRFEELDWMVIGYFVRSVKIQGTRYFWSEYLLYHSRAGFRWLTCSDFHWSFVKPLSPGAVTSGGEYAGKQFKLFQRAYARLEHVVGECYWQVQVGETVEASDFVRPPQMLSREASGGEVNWSLATYVPVKELERIFRVKNLRQPSTIAPNQPFLFKQIYYYWAALAFTAVLLFIIVSDNRPSSPAYDQVIQLVGEQADFFSEDNKPLVLTGLRPVEIAAEANGLQNNWLELEGELVNEESGVFQPFSLSLEYYQGFTEGEAWTEGAKHNSTRVSAQAAGKYSLHVHAQSGKPEPPTASGPLLAVRLRVTQRGPSGTLLLLVLGLLSLPPVGVIIYRINFEIGRWADSNITAP